MISSLWSDMSTALQIKSFVAMRNKRREISCITRKYSKVLVKLAYADAVLGGIAL